MDDSFYPEMANDNIYYINVKPYYYDYTFEEMLSRFKQSDVGERLIDGDEEFDDSMMEHIKLFKYKVIEKDNAEYEVDKVLGKHIISHLQTFFNRSTKNRTIKNRGTRKNKTLKHY
jgi:hypothetical protein